MKKYLLSGFLALVFFLIQLLTLGDYGISWDETLHFRRGQANLHYFLTGKLTYENLQVPDIDTFGIDASKEPSFRRSFYQNDLHNGEFFLTGVSAKKIGHPPLNDDLAAVLNYVFFQKLGVVDDISSYHLFNLLASSVLVFIVVAFALETFGVFAAVISFLALVTYPLFFSEAHFNIKDPAEAAFFAGAIWAFYRLLKVKKIIWVFIFFLFIAFALGTKFNILFLPLILLPFLLIQFPQSIKNPFKALIQIPKKFWFSAVSGLLLAGGIFIASWPSLWPNFPGSIEYVFKYYKDIGSGYTYQPDNFLILGFNAFATLWILFTTPPILLVLTFLGIVSLLFIRGEKQKVVLLFLVWLLVPILRVSVPGASIYGGVRQIMEFLPALALLSGAGAWWVVQQVKGKNFKLAAGMLLIVIFIYPTFILMKMHPHQNVYFNFLIGGLKGASERNFPSWGNSLGNAYKTGIDWLNKNAEQNAQVALVQGTKANAPLISFRSDINYDITNFSGIERKGEYLMELVFNDTGKAFYYRWEYVENFLDPVYELKVDGVAILKIWKNDLEHTRPNYRFLEKQYGGNIEISRDDRFITLTMDREVLLSRMDITLNTNCVPVRESYIETSLDRQSWTQEKDPLSSDQLIGVNAIADSHLKFLFAGRKARFIKVVFNNSQECFLKNSDVKFTTLH